MKVEWQSQNILSFLGLLTYLIYMVLQKVCNSSESQQSVHKS